MIVAADGGNTKTDLVVASLDGEVLARKLADRREQVALVLEQAVGPVVNNATRGDALIPNASKY